MVKQHLNRTLHEREVHAYRHWTTALGPSAPVLIAVDNAAMIIATSALPGASPETSDLTPDVYRQACSCGASTNPSPRPPYPGTSTGSGSGPPTGPTGPRRC